MSVQNHAAQVSRLRRLKETLFGSTQAPFELSVVQSCAFDTTNLAHTAGVSRLAELGRREVRELTPQALSTTDVFYSEVRDALEHRALIWLIGPIDTEQLKELAGPLFGLFVNVGAEHSQTQTVFGLRVSDVVHQLLPDASFRAALEGMNATRTPHGLAHKIEAAGVKVFKRSLITRVLKDPRFWVYAVVFVYSSLRALPVVFVPQFHGSVLVLWAIDVLTAIPYTWGILAMLTASRPLERYTGAIVALATFMAPYVYFWVHGRGYPGSVIIIVSLMIAASLATEVWRGIQNTRLVKRYSASRNS